MPTVTLLQFPFGWCQHSKLILTFNFAQLLHMRFGTVDCSIGRQCTSWQHGSDFQGYTVWNLNDPWGVFNWDNLSVTSVHFFFSRDYDDSVANIVVTVGKIATDVVYCASDFIAWKLEWQSFPSSLAFIVACSGILNLQDRRKVLSKQWLPEQYYNYGIKHGELHEAAWQNVPLERVLNTHCSQPPL